MDPQRPSSVEDDLDDRRSAKNLPWQKIFHKRIAPICLKIAEDRESLDEASFFKKYISIESGTVDICGENVGITMVRDARKPPPDLKYNQLTLALEDPNADVTSPRVGSDGVYLVREISAFPLAPNKPCVNERLFMDRKRENFKAKGWGTGRWRMWLALEDADAQKKKRKKAEIAHNASNGKHVSEYDMPKLIPGLDQQVRLYSAMDPEASISNKRFKDAIPMMPMGNATQTLFMPASTAVPSVPVARPSLFNGSLLANQQQHLLAAAQVMQQQQQQQQQQALAAAVQSRNVLGLNRSMMMASVPNPSSVSNLTSFSPLPSLSVHTPVRNVSAQTYGMQAQAFPTSLNHQLTQTIPHSTLGWVGSSLGMFPPPQPTMNRFV